MIVGFFFFFGVLGHRCIVCGVLNLVKNCRRNACACVRCTFENIVGARKKGFFHDVGKIPSSKNPIDVYHFELS